MKLSSVFKKEKFGLLVVLLLGISYLKVCAARHFESCNPLTAFTEIILRNPAISRQPGFILKESCISCSKPECDLNSDSCMNKYSYLKKSQKSRLVEFAFNAGYFTKEFTVLIKFTDTCAIALEFSSAVLDSLMEKLNLLSGIISECVDDKCIEINSCKTVYNDSDIFSFALMIKEDSKISLKYSKDPNSLATNNKVKHNYNFHTSCKYEFSKGLTVEYAFDHGEVTYPQINKMDGIPVILPCSSKGFPGGKRTEILKETFEMSPDEEFNEASDIINLDDNHHRRHRRNVDANANENKLEGKPSLKGVKRLFNFFFVTPLKRKENVSENSLKGANKVAKI